MLFMSKWKTGDSTIWRGKLTKQENGTHFQILSSKQVHAIASWFEGLKMMSFVKKQLSCTFKVTVD